MSGEKAELLVFDPQLKEERDYWIQRLSQEIGISNLITDYARPDSYAADKETVSMAFSDAVNKTLNKVSGGSPFLIYTILVSVVQLYLHRYTRNEMVVVGSPARKESGKPAPTVNVLPLITEIDEQLSFRQLLTQVRAVLLEAYGKQRYPFRRVVRDVGLSAPDNRCPIFDIIVSLKTIHGEVPELRNDLSLIFDQDSEQIFGQ